MTTPKTKLSKREIIGYIVAVALIIFTFLLNVWQSNRDKKELAQQRYQIELQAAINSKVDKSEYKEKCTSMEIEIAKKADLTLLELFRGDLQDLKKYFMRSQRPVSVIDTVIRFTLPEIQPIQVEKIDSQPGKIQLITMR